MIGDWIGFIQVLFLHIYHITHLNRLLADSSVHTLVHRPPRLVLILVVVSQASMLLLNTGMRLPSRKIRLISLRELLSHSADVRDQAIEQIK